MAARASGSRMAAKKYAHALRERLGKDDGQRQDEEEGEEGQGDPDQDHARPCRIAGRAGNGANRPGGKGLVVEDAMKRERSALTLGPNAASPTRIYVIWHGSGGSTSGAG